MITISEIAEEKLREIFEERGEGFEGFQLSVIGGVPGAYQSAFRFARPEDFSPDTVVVQKKGFKLFIDGASASKLDGAAIDFIETPRGGGFKIEYPIPQWDDPVAQKVQEVIITQINPGIAQHGGFVALLDVRDGIAYVAMGGGCHGCGLANETLKQGVEVVIKEQVPQIKAVVDTTDHATGTNPYYQAAQEEDKPSPLES